MRLSRWKNWKSIARFLFSVMFILSNIWLVLLFIKEALLLLLQHVEGAARPLIDLRWASNKAELDLCCIKKAQWNHSNQSGRKISSYGAPSWNSRVKPSQTLLQPRRRTLKTVIARAAKGQIIVFLTLTELELKFVIFSCSFLKSDHPYESSWKTYKWPELLSMWVINQHTLTHRPSSAGSTLFDHFLFLENVTFCWENAVIILTQHKVFCCV